MKPKAHGLSKVIATIALLFALAALFAAVLSLTSVIKPALTSSLTLPDNFTGIAAIAAFIAFIAGIIAKSMSRGYVLRRGSHAIMTAILTLVFCAASLGLSTLFPDGVIEAKVADTAPTSSSTQMQSGVEEAFGTCSEGWTSVDSSSYLGVKSISVCKSTYAAYATFESSTYTSVYRSPMITKAKELLAEETSIDTPESGWGTLTGDTWVVVGNYNSLTTLQKTWGGTLATIE